MHAKPSTLLQRWTLLLMLTVAGLFACGDEEYNAGSCGKDADCPASQLCNAGTCQDPDASGGGILSNGSTDNSTDSNDSGGTSNDAQICETTLPPIEPSAVTRIYTDSNSSDLSTYEGGFETDLDAPVGGVKVGLIGPGGEEVTTTTCADGLAAFGELAEGAYLVAPELPEGFCGQRNCPKRFPEAIREGQVKIVTFGDSVPAVGDAPYFPSRLADLLAPLATVNNANVAVPGTVSDNWLPGTRNFDQTLAPEIPDADVVMISLGGNDILAYVQSQAGNLAELLSNLDALIEAVSIKVAEIIDNIMTIAEAIRAINPNVDIVYLLYPDYSLAEQDMMWSLVNSVVGKDAVHGVLESARAGIPEDANITLVDVFGASEGLTLDDYMYDSLHFNNRGQTFYAEEIFKALGGVLIGPSPLQHNQRTPLGVESSYSVVP